MKRKNLAGVTLIETILYLGLFVIVAGVLFSYGWNVIGINIKAKIIQEVSQSAELTGEKINYEIRRANSVAIEGNKLTLKKDGEDDIVIENADDKITIKRGSNEAVALQSQNVKIENFVLKTQVLKTDGEPDEVQYVGYSFEAVANYAGSQTRSEYQYTLSYNSSSALRK